MSNDKKIDDLVNQALNDSTDDLPMEVRRRLAQARIEATQAKTSHHSMWKLASAFSFMLVIFLGWQWSPTSNDEVVDQFAEVLAEDLEMIDDLEFVYWMAEEGELANL